MEMIHYTLPTSWNDKGMNWANPDPANIDYIMAVRQAIVEKALLTGFHIPVTLFRLSPFCPLNLETLSAFREVIYNLAANFVDLSFQDYKPDGSDFPKTYDSSMLVLAEDCRIFKQPSKGARIPECADFLIAAKNILDNLMVVKWPHLSGMILSRGGSSHDPPSVTETIDAAIDRAMSNEVMIEDFTSFPQKIWNHTGTTHYSQSPGYCGYAASQALKIVMGMPPIPDVKCKIIIAAFAGKVAGNVGYSNETQYNDYDTRPLNISRGASMRDFGEWRDKITIELGDVDFFPKYPRVPDSQWEPALIRRGAWLGNEVNIHCLLDFGIPGGFRFQK